MYFAPQFQLFFLDFSPVRQLRHFSFLLFLAGPRQGQITHRSINRPPARPGTLPEIAEAKISLGVDLLHACGQSFQRFCSDIWRPRANKLQNRFGWNPDEPLATVITYTETWQIP